MSTQIRAFDQQVARSRFNRALMVGIIRRIIDVILGQHPQERDLDRLLDQHHIVGRFDAGYQTICIQRIVGSVSRSHDFDWRFYPLHDRMRERWQRIAQLFMHGCVLPPIEVYQVGDRYYVIDGNHRVSVMRQMGGTYIDAHVIQIEVG